MRRVMKIVGSMVIAFLLLGLCRVLSSTSDVSTPPLKEINYYPRNYAWEAFWQQWPQAKLEMDADLDRIQALGANTVRIFLHPSVFGYPQPDSDFLVYLEEALALIDAHGLKAHVNLFDCWWLWDDLDGSRAWLAAIVGPYQNDPRIAVWELQNEVQLDQQGVRDWVEVMFPYLKQQAGDTPCTVSVNRVEWLDDVRDLTNPTSPDVYSLHWYPADDLTWIYTFSSTLDSALQVVDASDLLLGEFGYNTYDLSEANQADLYRDVLYYAHQRGIVHLGAWTLNDFPTGTVQCAGYVPPPGERHFGLYRLDGSPKLAASILHYAFLGSPPSSPSPVAVLNSSFEDLNPNSGQLDDWRPWDQNWTGQQTFEQDCTVAHSGGCSVRVQRPVGVSETVGLYASTGFPVKPRWSYSLEGYVRTENLDGWTRIVLAWFDSQGGWLGADTYSQSISDPNSLQWERVGIDAVTPPASAAYFQVYAHMYSDDTDSCVWLDDVVLLGVNAKWDVYTAGNVASLSATVNLESVDGSMVPFAYGRPWPSFDRQSHHPTLDLGGLWRKQRVDLNHDLSLTDRSTALAQIGSESGGRYLASYDDSTWLTKTLPAVENEVPSWPDPAGAEVYENGVWYRRTFTVDSAWEGKQVRLVFLAVNYVADVWINGQWAGYHEGGYAPFALDVTGLVNYGVGLTNTIAVRVDNPPWGSRTDIVPAREQTDWQNYTGIIQDVYLEQLPQQYVARADVVPLDVDGNLAIKVVPFNASSTSKAVTATLQVYTAHVTATNITSPYASDLTGTLVSLSGITAGLVDVPANGSRVLTYSVGIPSPDLWTPADPNLYILKVTLLDESGVVDEFYTQFGVRTVGLGQDKFLLNNHPVFFTGIARHEDWPSYGRTATMDRIKLDLDLIKETNVNFLRTAHYPNHPYTYLLADRMGLAVMEEIPTWQFRTYEWADQEQRRIADQMWREMVLRDYNRPSIVLWSGTNEAEKTSLMRRRAFLTRINRDLKLNYYDGRMVTQSAAADRPGTDDHSMNAVDVAGWTTYFGVFYGDEHTHCATALPEEYYTGTLEFLDAAHANFPGVPILATEFGCWSGPAGALTATQVSVFSYTFKAFEDRQAVDSGGNVIAGGFVVGGTWWTAFDWFTQGGSHLQTMGISHMDRTTHKPVRAVMQSRYAPYYAMGGLASAITTPLPVEIPADYVVSQPITVPVSLLQDFEYEDSYYSDAVTTSVSLSSGVVQSGTRSLRMEGLAGPWHTLGVYIYDRPVDIASYHKLCVLVYDGQGSNTVELRLFDNSGSSQAVWSDKSDACEPTHTISGTWVQMCFNLTAFNEVGLSALNKAQITMYHEGIYYFDNMIVAQQPNRIYLPLVGRDFVNVPD